jgi:hypothetical protein
MTADAFVAVVQQQNCGQPERVIGLFSSESTKALIPNEGGRRQHFASDPHSLSRCFMHSQAALHWLFS